MLSVLVDAEPLDGHGQVGMSALYEEARERNVSRVSVMQDLENLQNYGWLWFERMPSRL